MCFFTNSYNKNLKIILTKLLHYNYIMELLVKDNYYVIKNNQQIFIKQINKCLPGDFVEFYDNQLLNNNTVSDCLLVKRNKHILAGILILNTKYKYGFKKDKEIFLFKPFKNNYPNMLVASKIKKNLIKNKKPIKNQYIVVKFIEWNKNLPTAEIIHLIGDIDNEINHCEIYLHHYQLYTPKLNFKDDLLFNYNHHKDITNLNIYSIDPKGCLDIDDAISYHNNIIGIHIADVSYILDNIQNLQCKRYSSIYLPHRQINMLPDKLSCNICSLLPGEIRPAFTTWITWDGDIKDFKFEKTIIKSNKAYSYNEADEIIYTKSSNNIYKLYKIVQDIGNKLFNYPVNDTHDMITVLMILTNHLVAKFLKNEGIIFRSHESSIKKSIITTHNYELLKFIQILHSNSATYSYHKSFHYGLNLNDYCHFTSPIRRYIDIYNHRLLNSVINKKDKPTLLNLDMINEENKRIKKLENKFNEIKLIYHSIPNKQYQVYLIGFDKKYMSFYIPEFKVIYQYRILDNRLKNISNISICDSKLIIKIQDKIIQFILYEELNVNFVKVNNKLIIDIDKLNIIV